MLRIFINPGHDMDLDPGACANGIREVDIALAIGQEVKKIMEGIGYPCQLIQSDNLTGETPSRPNVCGTANASGADIFVSIHCNSAGNPGAEGTETLIYSTGGEAEKLAECITITNCKCLGNAKPWHKTTPRLGRIKRNNNAGCTRRNGVY